MDLGVRNAEPLAFTGAEAFDGPFGLSRKPIRSIFSSIRRSRASDGAGAKKRRTKRSVSCTDMSS